MLSLSFSLLRSFPPRRSFHPPYPPRLLLRVSHPSSSSSNHYHHTTTVSIESNLSAIFVTRCPFLFLSFCLALLLFLLARALSLSLSYFALSRSLSCSRAGLGAANYPGHRYFLPRIKTDNRIITKIKVLNFVTFSLIKEVTIKQTCQLDSARTG